MAGDDNNGDHPETSNSSPPAMKMEHYLSHTDYLIWQVIQNENGPVSVTTDTNGMIKVLPPKTPEEVMVREMERKVRTTMLKALSEDHLAKFHKMADAKETWEAIKSRFGGNDESKKMQKYLFQTLLSQLEIHGAGVSHEVANQKFLRFLPSSWSQVALIIRTKPGLDTFSFDDLYNNIRVFEHDVKGTTASSSNTQNVAFVSAKKTSSTDDVSTAYRVSSPHINDDDKEEMDLKWQIRFMKIDLDDKTDVLAYHKKLLAETFKEKEDLKTKLENWKNSSKNLSKLLNTQMSANDMFGLGYEDSRYGSILSYKNEVLQSVFMNKASDLEDTHVNDRYADGMHAIHPPMIGNYMSSGPDVEIDYSKFTYGSKQTLADELDSKPSEYASCESNSSVETSTSMHEPVENASKVVCGPNVWTDAPIIEEYESDSDNDSVSNVQEDKEKPSFSFTKSVKHVKTSRENIKETGTTNHSPKIEKQDKNGHTKKGLGYAFTRKACFFVIVLAIS
nr:ribonuclease H-like domain-containing protein [Tanacetum cinerariifolium]